MIRTIRLAMLASLGLLAVATSARAEIDPLTRQPLMVSSDPSKAQATAIPREVVSFSGKYNPGTIVINTTERRLYYVMPDGKAMRYGVGVGRPGFDWAGAQTITRKTEWPTWTPPAQMLKRRPDLPRFMPGGPENPMGARAMYLGSTLYRIHGSNEPETIGQAVSSGCIRMLNEDVMDLYERAKVGTRVVVAR
jgi:lipoprotein-anchoring transpeptidase ErfK/SrfK